VVQEEGGLARLGGGRGGGGGGVGVERRGGDSFSLPPRGLGLDEEGSDDEEGLD